MSRRGESDVIVVGAGAVGAALALALARDGLDVAMVETREPSPWRADDDLDLRVVALAADARSLFDELGVWRAVQDARACAYRYMRVWDALAPGELALDAADDGAAALGWIVENRLIQHALWQALADDRSRPSDGYGEASPVRDRWASRGRSAEPRDAASTLPGLGRDRGAGAGENRGRVRIHCPAEVADVEQDADSVSAVLDDGTRLRARLLVAADGAESSLRARLGIPFEGRDYAQRAVVAHVATERPHQDTAWQRFLPEGPLAFLPLSDGRSSIVWSLPERDAERVLGLDDDSFRAALGCAFDFRLGTILESTRRAAFPLRMRLADRYAAGRCVLIGDAAHLVHPLAGQGMNLGLRDVARLREVIRAAHAQRGDIGAAHVLRRYERDRRSENAVAAYGLDGIERAFRGRALAPLRGLGLALATRVGPLRALLVGVASGRR